jgi:hypothetical protein
MISVSLMALELSSAALIVPLLSLETFSGLGRSASRYREAGIHNLIGGDRCDTIALPAGEWLWSSGTWRVTT